MQKSMYEQLFELFSEAVTVTRNGKILYMNPRAKEMFPEAVRKGTLEGILPEFIYGYEGSRFSATADIAGEKRLISVSEVDKDRVFTVHPSDDGEVLRGWDSFLSSISGELRSAMSVIRMSSEMASSHTITARDSKAEMYSAMLAHNAYIATRIMNNIDMLRNMVSGGLKKEEHYFDFAELCGDVVGTVNAMLDRGDFAIEFIPQSDTIDFIGDRGLVEQLVLNLLSNSIKYTDSDGKITVTVSEKNGGAVLSVSDNGKGIRPERIMSSFERYLDRRDMRDTKAGSRLGLAIVDHIARLHNGYALLESTPDSGTKVTVLLKSGKANKLRDPGAEYVTRSAETVLTVMADVFDYKAYLPKYLD